MIVPRQLFSNLEASDLNFYPRKVKYRGIDLLISLEFHSIYFHGKL